MTTQDQSKFKKIIQHFNSIYDFFSRIIKVILFIFVAVIIYWKLPYIDWNSTSENLIDKNTPLKFEQPSAEKTLNDTNNLEKSNQAPKAETNSQAQYPNKKSLEYHQEKIDYLNIYQFGQIVFSVDKPYEINSDTIIFDKLLLKGRPNYDKLFLYAGVEIKIIKINEYIGMLVSGGAVQGPLLKGVYCKVIRR